MAGLDLHRGLPCPACFEAHGARHMGDAVFVALGFGFGRERGERQRGERERREREREEARLTPRAPPSANTVGYIRGRDQAAFRSGRTGLAPRPSMPRLLPANPRQGFARPPRDPSSTLAFRPPPSWPGRAAIPWGGWGGRRVRATPPCGRGARRKGRRGGRGESAGGAVLRRGREVEGGGAALEVPVERTWHIQDGQGQILALAFR